MKTNLSATLMPDFAYHWQSVGKDMASSRACEMLARCLPSACEMLAISDARVCRPPKQNYRWLTPELRQSPKLTTRFVVVMVAVHFLKNVTFPELPYFMGRKFKKNGIENGKQTKETRHCL